MLMRSIRCLCVVGLSLQVNSEHACSLNGDFVNGRCKCDPQWQGDDCERLRLLPGNPAAGLQTQGELGVFSSWGGSVEQDGNGTYHMYASVMEHECGLNAWRPNSAIGHSTSDRSPAGPYKLQSIIKPHFAHSPEVVRGIDGSWLVYHVGAGANDTKRCPDPNSPTCQYVTNCSRGITGPQHAWMDGLSFYGPFGILRASTPYGPWKSFDIAECVDVPGCEPMPSRGFPGNGNDMNPAPLINKDGSVVLLWRSILHFANGSGQSYYASASAPAWNGTYNWSVTNLFPDFSWCHIEDGFLYKNTRGWHALFHSDCEKTSGGAAGGHAYSKDGVHWTFHAKNAYHNNITLEGQQQWTLNRRERPKLILDSNGHITHLINGVGLPGEGDHTFTFIQAISQQPHDEWLV